MRYFSLILLITALTGCAGSKNYLKDSNALVGRSLPPMVVEDVTGNKFSTYLFREKETALIFVAGEAAALKSLQKPQVFAWRVIDTRKKKWYIPGFWYNRRFKQNKKFIYGNELMQKMKLAPGNYRIELSKGKITSIKNF